MVNDNTWSAKPLYGRDITQEMRNVNALEFNVNVSYGGKWGSAGSDPGEFDILQAVTVDNDGNVWTCEVVGADRIQKFSSTGTFLLELDPADFEEPFGLAIASNGNLLVVQGRTTGSASSGKVLEFDTAGNFIGILISTVNIISLAVDSDGNIYVTTALVLPNTIQKYNSLGVFQLTWGSTGFGDGQFLTVIEIAVDSNDLVYVVDRDNFRIQVFNEFGVFQSKFSTNGSQHRPLGLTIRNNGTEDLVYVSIISSGSGPFDTIEIFQTDGTAIGVIGGHENAPSSDGLYDNIRGLGSLLSGGNLYATDVDNDRIQYYTSNVLTQTEFVKYTTGGVVSLGTPDGGVTVPALDALDSGAALVAPDHIIDIRTAIEALAPFYTNAITGNAFNWNGAQADSLYRIALGNRDTNPSDFGFSSPTPADDWQRTKVEMDNDPTYDIDIGEVALCIDKLQASVLE